jgi:CRP/FNR family transcriptional regulator
MAHLRSLATHFHVRAGGVLVEEGDQLEYVYNVISGMLKIYRELPDGRALIMEFATGGDFLGLPAKKEACCSVQALSATEVCYFRRSDFEHLLKTYPSLRLRLLVMASNTIVAQQEHLLSVGRETASEKLASFLLILARRKSCFGGVVETVDLPMTRYDIADYLGMTAESVSRTLSKLKALGLIDLPQPDQAILLRPAELKHLSNLEHFPMGRLALTL